MSWTRRQPNGRWRVAWRDPEGVIVSETYDRLEDAKRRGRDVEGAKDRGVYVDPRLARRTLGEWWDTFLEASPHLRRTTRSGYEMHWRLHLAPFLKHRRIGSVTSLDLKRWVTELSATGAGAATVAASARLLHRMFATAVEAGVIARNPADRLKTPKASRHEMRALSASELASVVDAVPDRDRALVLVMGLGGLRFGEALALTAEDVDPLHRTIRVTKASTEVNGVVEVGRTKTSETRAVPVPRVVAEALEHHLASYPPGRSGLLFADQDGGFIRRSNWRRRVWMPALQRVGLSGVRVHDLRHTAASLAIATGANVRAVQALLGHSSATVTLNVYAHLLPSAAETLAERMDAAFAAAASVLPGRSPEIAPIR